MAMKLRDANFRYGWATDHLPWWLVRWWWPTFCSHHDQPASRWHRRRCKHRYVVVPEESEEHWRKDWFGGE